MTSNFHKKIINAKDNQQKSKKNNIITNEDKKNEYFTNIQKLKEKNFSLSIHEWSQSLFEKKLRLNEKINEYFPDMLLPLDFIVSVKTILNIKGVTLPFMGIIFAAPSSMKSQAIELFRQWIYSYFTDKFTAKSFVSHSATVAKNKLTEIDMLPRIKNKFLLTPELSPLFTGKDDDIKEQFGIITRLLDGKGLETDSGVHGKRGYYGEYMFTWIGAAVDIPKSIYKFLSTIGFKIYFLRLPRIEITSEDLMNQLISPKQFNEKIKEIEELIMTYLTWFEICPISLEENGIRKIEWNTNKDDIESIKIIAELAILLAHLRGDVTVYKSSDTNNIIPIDNNRHSKNTPIDNIGNKQAQEYIHGLPKIENPSRVNQQMYKLARGYALSKGRNYITKEDITLIIKVVLSTSLIERMLILDLLIANNGTLTTSEITAAMRISNDTAKKTMTEFKALELVTMKRNGNNSNSEYKISLNQKFKWFLTEEFKNLRDSFKPIDNKNCLKPKSNRPKNNNSGESDNNDSINESKTCYDKKSPCVNEINYNNQEQTHHQQNQKKQNKLRQNDKNFKREENTNNSLPISNGKTKKNINNSYNDKNFELHKGEKHRSKTNSKLDKEKIFTFESEKQSIVYKCYYCNFETMSEDVHLTHSITKHPGKVAQPDLSLLEMLRIEPKLNPWEK